MFRVAKGSHGICECDWHAQATISMLWALQCCIIHNTGSMHLFWLSSHGLRQLWLGHNSFNCFGRDFCHCLSMLTSCEDLSLSILVMKCLCLRAQKLKWRYSVMIASARVFISMKTKWKLFFECCQVTSDCPVFWK